MNTKTKIRTYSELIRLPTFEERFRYLELSGIVGETTFAHERRLNQIFYRSPEWKKIRDYVIMRDNGCDLAMEGFEIARKVIVHHMNPVSIEDVLEHNADIIDPEFLVCCSNNTHQAIHYSDEGLLVTNPIQRLPNDTCPWRQIGG